VQESPKRIDDNTPVYTYRKEKEVPGYAKICGILALIFSIVGWFIPVIGVILITPIAIVLGIIALRGGTKGMGIASTIIIVVNLFISPSFWVNVGLGAVGSKGNALMTWFDIVGVILMFYFIVKKRA
jgi:hypothetical protein